MKHYHHTLKLNTIVIFSRRVLMLGDTAVGKSSLVSQFMTSEYLHAYDTSIGRFIKIIQDKIYQINNNVCISKYNFVFDHRLSFYRVDIFNVIEIIKFVKCHLSFLIYFFIDLVFFFFLLSQKIRVKHLFVSFLLILFRFLLCGKWEWFFIKFRSKPGTNYN